MMPDKRVKKQLAVCCCYSSVKVNRWYFSVSDNVAQLVTDADAALLN